MSGRAKCLSAAFFVAAVTVGSVSSASITLVNSSAALGANDTINWSQLGPDSTPLLGDRFVTSAGGVSARVSDSDGSFERRDQGTGWSGNFAFGTPLIWDQRLGSLSIDFVGGVFGVGAQIQADIFGSFDALVTAGGTTYTLPGDSTPSQDGSAIFLGVLSDVPNITSVTFQTNTNDFAIGTLALNTVSGSVSAVPEASTWSMLILGFGLIGTIMRRFRKSEEKFTAGIRKATFV